METIVGVAASVATALLAAGIVGLVSLNAKVARLIAVVEGLTGRFDDHVKSDERRLTRLEESTWPQSRAR